MFRRGAERFWAATRGWYRTRDELYPYVDVVRLWSSAQRSTEWYQLLHDRYRGYLWVCPGSTRHILDKLGAGARFVYCVACGGVEGKRLRIHRVHTSFPSAR